uniref:HTH psq-type domain-containing protein n=1 Tax=Trichuris muris TaxID=70415 RepID=A0A5S6QPW4_TRIMR
MADRTLASGRAADSSRKKYAEVGRRVGKNESSIRAIKQKEAQIRQSACTAPTMAKRVSVVGDKLLAKTERALSLWIEQISPD